MRKKIQPKFKVGDCMRAKVEAQRGITDGLPYVLSISDGYYYCNNEKIPVDTQDEYEYPPMSNVNEVFNNPLEELEKLMQFTADELIQGTPTDGHGGVSVDSVKQLIKSAVQIGANWRKDTFERDAVIGEVTVPASSSFKQIRYKLPKDTEYKIGDKVKLAILKDE